MNASTSVPVRRDATSVTPRPLGNVFTALQQEVDRLFRDFGNLGATPFSAAGAVIRMDMSETDEGIELTAELPGLEEKDVTVTLADSRLTISGEKSAEKEEKDKSHHLIERSYGAFSRSIDLPADIQADKIQATLANGVLKVAVPRATRPQPKTIEVKSGA